ncbi:hotdog fold thioesterase [Humibacter soli]
MTDATAGTTGDDGTWRIVLGELDVKMGVEIVEQSAERVVATMPVEGNRQSFGMLHGGASVAFAEALGSWAAVIHAGPGKSAVGIDINATHHRSARSGRVTGVAQAISLGRRVTSHAVTITDDDGRLLCTARITNLIVDAAPQIERRPEVLEG